MGHPLLDLTNQTAVVIGGTSGIGLALTEALAQAGADVVPTGRRAEQVRTAARRSQSAWPAVSHPDLRCHRTASLDLLLQSVIKEFGRFRY